MKTYIISLFIFFFLILPVTGSSSTRDEVIKRGFLLCGVSTGMPGFSNADDKGKWSGLDVDICRAAAAAVLHDADKVKYVPLLPKERATLLLSGEIDILSRNFAWDLTRDSSLNMNFIGMTFFDQQGFLVNNRMNVKSVLELKEFSVCLLSGAGYDNNLEEYLSAGAMKYRILASATPDQIIKDFEAGRCEIITGGRAQLQGMRSKLTQPGESSFLTETIVNEPLGAAVRHGDDLWFDIVKWSFFAMINAEELGLTSENIDGFAGTSNPAVQRFMGRTGIGGKGLGLRDDWARNIIKQVGNYSESFERNLGQASPLKLQRGLNALWNDGGLMLAPPMR